METTFPIGNHEHYVKREFPPGRVLVALLTASIATLATGLFAQSAPSLKLTHKLSDQNAVSTNQLLTPNKSLQAVQRARNYLIAGRIDQAQKEITYALGRSPRCALALNVQGAIHLVTRQFENAGVDYREAIQADSDWAQHTLASQFH